MNDLRLAAAYARRSDPNAFRELVIRYHPFVFSVCRRQLSSATDADDATQEVFLKLAQNCHAIESTVGGWLHRCAMNVCASMVRASQSRRKRELAAGGAVPAPRDDQHWSEVREELDQCLSELRQEDLQLIVQYYFLGQSQGEIASEQGTSRQAIQKQLSAAVDQLRSSLKRRDVAVPVVVLATHLGTRAIEASIPVASRAAAMKIGLAAVSRAATPAGHGLSVATSLGLATVVAIAVAAGFFSLNANGHSNQTQGDAPMGGLIARASEVGEWAAFSGSGSKSKLDRNGQPLGRESFDGIAIRVSIVGEAVEDGELCRWIEIKREEPRRKVIQKVLIPARHLHPAGHPLDHVVRGWRKVDDSEPRRLEPQEIKSRLYLYLPGQLDGRQSLADKTIDYKSGVLPCRGWTGVMRFEESQHKYNASFKTWVHDDVPLGVASCESTVEVDEGPKGTDVAILKIDLVDHGRGAVSELAGCN